MRDKHLDFHCAESHVNQSSNETLPLILDSSNLQPLLFDLVSINDVKSVENLPPFFEQLSYDHQEELLRLVGHSASTAMAKLIYERVEKHIQPFSLYDFMVAFIEGKNFESLTFLLSDKGSKISQKLNVEDATRISIQDHMNMILFHSVATGSMELIRVVDRFVVEYHERNGRSPLPLYMKLNIIKATAGCSDREEYLINAWSTHGIANLPSAELSALLMSIGATTCSIRLAQVLLQHGATVDWRESQWSQRTALKTAARKDSAEAADFMKYLLYQGANPNSFIILRRMKGPKNISKWLGVSWDELVQKVNEDRKRGIQWP